MESRAGFPGLLRGAFAAIAVATPWLMGCGFHAGDRPAAQHAERATQATDQVSDDAFAGAVHDLLLSDPGSNERAVRLRAVESRQMSRAAARFKARAPERGLASVSGGLYLVRIGEAVQGALGPDGPDALRGAARELALRGDEGRAQAIYDLLAPLTSGPEKADLLAHLDAIEAWNRSGGSSDKPVASAGALERAAVRRRLLEPGSSALTSATAATAEWIKRSIVLRDQFRRTRANPNPDEGREAYRGLGTGPAVLAALYLRDADPAGAMRAIDATPGARELLESEHEQFASALEAAAQDPSIDRCIDLLHQLGPFTGRDPRRVQDEDLMVDRDVFAAAAFAMAEECYRLDPTVPEVAIVLGISLQEEGMAEAAPAVLVEAVKAHPEARVLSESLAVTLEVMTHEASGGDVGAARRAYHAAAPLLAAASAQHGGVGGKVRPSAARVRAAMGDIELREGRIDDARALLEQSAAEEKAGDVLLSLARITWRDGKTDAALGQLRDALETRDAAHDPALRGEILLTISDITRDKGDAAAARTPLTEALKGLVQSRTAGDGDERARTERVLSRVLDRFGAAQPAQRALERAYEAAAGDKHQAAATIELLIGRAFVRGDLPAARDGLQRALAADLDNDDLVYFALWVKLLERQLHAASDGTADHVFASLPDDGRWPAMLARFGEGKLKGDDLVAKSTTPIQRYEALFYAAMDHRASGDTKGGDDLLRQVVAGTGLELSEVMFARDLLDPGKAASSGPLPSDVSIP
jgi:tetratricopeptide (TPR) repeat protein